MNTKDKLQKAYSLHSHICVGLDTDSTKLPQPLLNEANPVLSFNKKIIDATREHCAAYKINFAFYEAEGLKGIDNLFQTIEYIGGSSIVIGDAKRGDIGNTAEQYAKSIFDVFKCDCATVNPLMGIDTLQPFISREDKISYALGLTSNPGAADFEKEILADGRMLFQKIIEQVSSANKNKNCGIVFGATKLEDMIENINRLKNLHLLIPGIGAQGGDLTALLKILAENRHDQFLINVSRSVIYKSQSTDFDEAAKEEVIRLNKIVREYFG